MKNTTLCLVLLAIFSTVLIAGCTQQQPVVTTTPAPVVTAVSNVVVQNQQGVAIIKTVAVQTTLPTVTNVTNQTKTEVGNVTNQTKAVVGNVTNQTQEKK